jgi:hypothetical protein
MGRRAANVKDYAADASFTGAGWDQISHATVFGGSRETPSGQAPAHRGKLSHIALHPMSWGRRMGLIVWLALAAVLIWLTLRETPEAVESEGRRLLILAIVPLPWIIELVLGQMFKAGPGADSPGWTARALQIAFFANPLLWIGAVVRLRNAWRFVLPFLGFNLVSAAFGSMAAFCSLSGTCS